MTEKHECDICHIYDGINRLTIWKSNDETDTVDVCGRCSAIMATWATAFSKQKFGKKWLHALTQEIDGNPMFDGETDLYHGTQTLYLTGNGLQKLIQNLTIAGEKHD